MGQPRCITDAPGPLPDEDEVIEALDDTDPNVLRAAAEHPGLDFSNARWDELLDAVVLPRAELEKVESVLRWEVWNLSGHMYVLAWIEGGTTLAAQDPGATFEGAYIASPALHRARCA